MLKQFFKCFIVSCLMPIAAYATITESIIVENHTDSDATASSAAFYNACSLSWGEKRGVIRAHGSISLKPSMINLYCADEVCDANIHMSRDCSGKIIGSANISSNGGILDFVSTPVDGYLLVRTDAYHAVIVNI